ncbi:serine hydrolase domain-containing protein [Embleya sp. AB8]|uniref:serine hydrolase domain-containing protein n=1 Tax=Embleya sp. AB8 TaxID=3156304 RepID=UPI003C72FBF9
MTRTPGPDDPALRGRLCAAVEAVDAPDVLFAYSRDGVRTVCSGGTGPASDTSRSDLQYQAGSVSKTFTGLLLAALVEHRHVRYHDRVSELLGLPPTPSAGNRDRITLLHLITHTAGLPRLPHDLYRRAAPRWNSNPYARYDRHRLVAAFARSRPSPEPGRRWHYSNLGVALLAPVLEQATGSPYVELLDRYVTTPLGLARTGLGPDPSLPQAIGHRRNGAPLPAWDCGGWVAAGGIQSTLDDLLTYLEAHVRPADTPPVARALRAVQTPLLARGRRPDQEHTLTWFRHPTPDGPVLFHSGATAGQHMFLGCRPTTGTAVVAIATCRHHLRSALIPTAYELLTTSGEE